MASTASAAAAVIRPIISAAAHLGAGAARFTSFELAGGRTALTLHLQRDANSHRLSVPLEWLRDHCRSASSFDAQVCQRRSNMASSQRRGLSRLADGNSQSAVRLDSEGRLLRLQWADGRVSRFSADEILDWGLPIDETPIVQEQRLWMGDAFLTGKPVISVDDLSSISLTRQLIRDGWLIVTGVSSDATAIGKLLDDKVAPTHNTFFDALSVFSNRSADESPDSPHDDAAYGSDAIGPHVDGTYLAHAPGIQVFSCFRRAERGGETLLVDGFAAAERLRQNRPELFHRLCEMRIDHHYLEGGGNRIHSISYNKPVLELSNQGRVVQLRFNPYDRAPLRWLSLNQHSSSKIDDFYEAYCAFSEEIHRKDAAVEHSIRPGELLFVDNHRVLHARTAFQGHRIMFSTYLSRDTLLALARPHLPAELKHFY